MAKRSSLCGDPFCLGLPEWTDCCTSGKENEAPAAKKTRLSVDKSKRFRNPVTDSELDELSKGFTPANTERNTRWALKAFLEWREQRNSKSQDDRCPEDLLGKGSVIQLNKWLSLFVAEARKTDGTPYPPRTLYQILAGLLRYSRKMSPEAPNFLDKKDPRFSGFRGTCDSIFRNLREKGVGANEKRTEIFTAEEETKLWTSGVLNDETPKGLQNAVFFGVGKVFCLRGGEEQRKLKVSQFVREHNPNKYVYCENGSKNRSGRLNQLHLQNKIVPVFENPSAGSRCLVHLLDLYFEKLPKFASEKDIFYCKPKSAVPSDPSAAWYDSVAVGKHKLSGYVSSMCEDAGVSRKTNHALRATGTTDMYIAKVPERTIQERTGHRSLEALRKYERPTSNEIQAVSNLLTTDQPRTSYDAELEKTYVQESASVTRSSIRHTQCVKEPQESTARGFMGSLFGTLTNCTINISPNTMNCNFQPQFGNAMTVEEDVAALENYSVQDLFM